MNDFGTQLIAVMESEKILSLQEELNDLGYKLNVIYTYGNLSRIMCSGIGVSIDSIRPTISVEIKNNSWSIKTLAYGMKKDNTFEELMAYQKMGVEALILIKKTFPTQDSIPVITK